MNMTGVVFTNIYILFLTSFTGVGLGANTEGLVLLFQSYCLNHLIDTTKIRVFFDMRLIDKIQSTI